MQKQIWHDIRVYELASEADINSVLPVLIYEHWWLVNKFLWKVLFILLLTQFFIIYIYDLSKRVSTNRFNEQLIAHDVSPKCKSFKNSYIVRGTMQETILKMSSRISSPMYSLPITSGSKGILAGNWGCGDAWVPHDHPLCGSAETSLLTLLVLIRKGFDSKTSKRPSDSQTTAKMYHLLAPWSWDLFRW